MLILLSYVLAYVAVFLISSTTTHPRPYYYYPICVGFNFVLLLLFHRKMRESISVTYKVVLIVNHLLSVAPGVFEGNIESLYILHESLYFLLAMVSVEFGFQLLYPLHTIYVMMTQILTLAVAFVGTVFVRGLLQGTVGLYVVFGVVTGPGTSIGHMRASNTEGRLLGCSCVSSRIGLG